MALLGACGESTDADIAAHSYPREVDAPAAELEQAGLRDAAASLRAAKSAAERDQPLRLRPYGLHPEGGRKTDDACHCQKFVFEA